MNSAEWRDDLYRQYVTRFTGLERPMDAQSLQSYLEWCGYKYGPLLAGISRDAPVLELGCGPGNLLLYLAGEGFSKARGIDISEEQVEIALGRGLQVEVADAFELLPRVAGEYEAVFAIDFLEHFEKSELLELLHLIY